MPCSLCTHPLSCVGNIHAKRIFSSFPDKKTARNQLRAVHASIRNQLLPADDIVIGSRTGAVRGILSAVAFAVRSPGVYNRIGGKTVAGRRVFNDAGKIRIDQDHITVPPRITPERLIGDIRSNTGCWIIIAFRIKELDSALIDIEVVAAADRLRIGQFKNIIIISFIGLVRIAVAGAVAQLDIFVIALEGCF